MFLCVCMCTYSYVGVWLSVFSFVKFVKCRFGGVEKTIKILNVCTLADIFGRKCVDFVLWRLTALVCKWFWGFSFRLDVVCNYFWSLLFGALPCALVSCSCLYYVCVSVFWGIG